MQVIRTMENGVAKTEVFADGSLTYTYATPVGVVVASSWVDIPEVFPVFVAGEYISDGLRQA